MLLKEAVRLAGPSGLKSSGAGDNKGFTMRSEERNGDLGGHPVLFASLLLEMERLGCLLLEMHPAEEGP